MSDSPQSRPSVWAVALFVFSCAFAVLSLSLFSGLYAPI